MVLRVAQVVVVQFAGGEALQPEVVEPRHHLFGTRAFLHCHGLQPDGAPAHPFEVTVQLGCIRDDFLPFVFIVLARARIHHHQNFFSFFFFLFIRRGCGGNIPFSFSFFLFLKIGLVVRLLSVCCPHSGGGLVVKFIFTNGYGCPFVVRFLTKYSTQLHFFEQSKYRSSGDMIGGTIAVYTHLHPPLLVGLHEQE